MAYNQITIRKMVPEDCDDIAYIDGKCIQNPWSKEDFEDLFRYLENYYWVAETEGVIVGFVGIIQFVDAADITRVAVLENYRGRHIASMLMDECKAFSKSIGIKEIHLEVRVSNLIAQKLYEKCGFETIATRKLYYTNPIEDAYVMECKL